jgi:hypothetical protein
MLHFALKYLAVLFAGGVATSYAEYRFKYNLYEDIKAIPAKVKGLFSRIKSLFHGKKQ